MRSYVMAPMRHGRLFLAGDAAHIVPPTGAKGLNLAISDVALLAPALTVLAARGRSGGLADAYLDTALRRVWRCRRFSWWMTTMLHRGGDEFDAQLQQSQLRWVVRGQRGRRHRPGRELRRPADRLLRNARGDVLVQVEDVVRVDGGLERGEPGQLRGRSRRAVRRRRRRRRAR